MDRVMRGSLIDFLSVGVGSLRTGIFNVGDVAILTGLVFFIVTYRKGNRFAH
jgi:signal peptidase II